MGVEGVVASPRRRSPSFRRQYPQNELGSWSTLLRRHQFLLTALLLLAFLCTVYLYFAVTLGSPSSCSGLAGSERALCNAKASLAKGKLKFF